MGGIQGWVEVRNESAKFSSKPPTPPQTQGDPASTGTSQRPRSMTTSSYCAMTVCSSSPAWAAACSKPTWTPFCSTHCQSSASMSSRPSWLGCVADQLQGAVGRHPAAGLTLPPTQVYPHGVPEDQLRLITSLVYLYSRSEIGQWNITSRDTVVALLASDVALENQTEVRAAWGRGGRCAAPGPADLGPADPGPASRLSYRSTWTTTAPSPAPCSRPSGAPASAG